MLLARRQPDKPAAATNKLCSIRTRNGVYTEFGIDPPETTTFLYRGIIERLPLAVAQYPCLPTPLEDWGKNPKKEQP